MAEPVRVPSRRIKVSSKRQITIPADAYKKLGFSEYALMEQTEDGLLITPVKVEDERMSLEVLRSLVAEGYEGEALVERYAAVCPRVIHFEDVKANSPMEKSATELQVPSWGPCEDERAHVLDAVAQECARFAAITRGYVFGSFARGDFAGQSDVDVRLEYDKEAPFTLFEVAQFQKHLERVTGRGVDVVTAKQVKNPNLAASIEREKVLVYER
ncbi:nucleotidyltransferase domain-containing protein [Parvibacter caecicola]|uniref:SpoVT-AbrB domain-containing protein n=1 Tax=Parvibacter caecicola TaxID=747645 RepID=A0A4T9T716_9ACTN|nr:nucleotidyltransferase domain-containing protein [Parvibacter caecicola]TJW10302.1 hypothetical protein E5982_07070 [Parvibacter caecicola]